MDASSESQGPAAPSTNSASSSQSSTTATTSAATPVQSDWVEARDPNSGKVYYANLKTRQTTWEKPADFVRSVAAVPALAKSASTVSTPTVAAAAPGAAAKSAWMACVDAKSGRTYYYHSQTRETRWHKPLDFVAPSSSAASPGPAPVAPATSATATANVIRSPSVLTTEAPPSVSVHAPAPIATTAPLTSQLSASLLGITSMQSGAPSLSAPAAPTTSGTVSDTTQAAAPLMRTLSVTAAAAAADDNALRRKLPSGLLASIQNFQLEGYANTHFAKQKAGLFGKKETIEQMLRFNAELLKHPLLKLGSEVAPIALQANRNILSYMGDRQSSKEPSKHAAKLLRNGLDAAEDVRDEIYCQLCKQTNDNPNELSTVRGWQLMALCASVFPPSTEFANYLMNYIEKNASLPSKLRTNELGIQESFIKQDSRRTMSVSKQVSSLVEGQKSITAHDVPTLAAFTLHRLVRILEDGPRREVPVMREIEATQNRKPCMLRVHFVNETFKTVPVESFTTAIELRDIMAHKLKLKNAVIYSIAEVVKATPDSPADERFLEDDERIMDLVSVWESEQSKSQGFQGHLLFKIRLFLALDETDQEQVNMYYMQAVADVVAGRYPTTEQDVITLAALQMQCNFGDYTGNSELITGKLATYIPLAWLQQGKPTEWEEKILLLYAKLLGYETREAKLSYLDYCKNWPLFSTSFFNCQQSKKNDLPAEVLLAVGSSKLFVCDPIEKTTLKTFEYAEIVTWGHSADNFVVVCGNLVAQDKTYFETPKGREINYLVSSYVNALVGKPIQSINKEERTRIAVGKPTVVKRPTRTTTVSRKK
eukprot:GILK01003428.1.p1 GENE.GILK01003428.1~~GILK01003428.1.p1  ORF type:complete len:838 (+),score=147.49 GILK01003428.1:48-2516(+)